MRAGEVLHNLLGAVQYSQPGWTLRPQHGNRSTEAMERRHLEPSALISLPLHRVAQDRSAYPISCVALDRVAQTAPLQ